MNEVYLLTGGNMGDRTDFLQKARKAISEKCGRITKASSIYETAAWGKEDQQAFLNQAIELETTLSPAQLLETILGIEEGLGRKREEKYGPRLIDIDILFFNDLVVNEPGLTIPHPQIQFRRFVLVPLSELNPGKLHPLSGKTVEELLLSCTDPLAVNKFC
jgi:2-amino-4-hydroxy-6-hydroxymethyldihydropteridine diphosphokinase